MRPAPARGLRPGNRLRRRPRRHGRRWADDGAEWLHLVDLDGAKAGRPVNHEVVRRIVQAVGIPCQVGGGLRDEASIRLLLEEIGVTRVILGTAALKQPDWFARMAELFPGRLCLGLDARNSTGRHRRLARCLPDLAHSNSHASLPSLDLGAIIYTNIANDGMLQGIDPGTLADLAALADLDVPVIASGGVTTADDIRRLCTIAADHPQLVGAIVGRALYEGTLTCQRPRRQ